MRMGKLRVFLAAGVIMSAPLVLGQADNTDPGEESPPVSSESSTAPTTTSPEAPVESPLPRPGENDVPPNPPHSAPPPPLPSPREPVDRPSPDPVSPGVSQGRPGRPIHPAPAPEGGSFFEPPRVETETSTSSVTTTSEVTTTVVEEPTTAEPVDETEQTSPPEVDRQRPTKGFSDPLGGGRKDGDPFDPKNEEVYRVKPQPLFAAGDLTGLFVIGVAILFIPFVVHDGRRFTKNNTCR